MCQIEKLILSPRSEEAQSSMLPASHTENRGFKIAFKIIIHFCLERLPLFQYPSGLCLCVCVYGLECSVLMSTCIHSPPLSLPFSLFTFVSLSLSIPLSAFRLLSLLNGGERKQLFITLKSLSFWKVREGHRDG